MNETAFEDVLRSAVRAAAPLDVPRRLEDRARAIPRLVPLRPRWRRWTSPLRTGAALASILVAAVVLASVVLVARGPGLLPGGSGPPNPVRITSPFGSLSASDLELVIGGRVFRVPSSAAQPGVARVAFTGSSTYGQLTVQWLDGTSPETVVMRFAADEQTWWVSEIIATDGRSQAAGWLYFEGPFFERPLGTAFSGTLTLSSVRSTYGESGSLRFGDLNLRAFASTAPRNPTGGTMPPLNGSGGYVGSPPDFVSVVDRNGTVVGYIVGAELDQPVAPITLQTSAIPGPDLPVYGPDLRTLVGYSVPGKGFEPSSP